MNLEQAQNDVDKFIKTIPGSYWAPLSNLARLVEEVGELARIINQESGQKIKKPNEVTSSLSEEIGDVLFTLICLANSQDINLEESLRNVIAKYIQRDHPHYLKIKSTSE